MGVINRCVVIVKVKEPFLGWLQSLPDPTDITIDEINADNSVYLLPEYEDDTNIFAILEHFYDLIFEEQLNNWWTDESCWPSNSMVKDKALDYSYVNRNTQKRNPIP